MAVLFTARCVDNFHLHLRVVSHHNIGFSADIPSFSCMMHPAGKYDPFFPAGIFPTYPADPDFPCQGE
jgi:hypothetical protein